VRFRAVGIASAFLPCKQARVLCKTGVLIGVLLCALLMGPARLRAQILLEGSAAAVRLEAKQAPIGEILAALGKGFGLRYRASIDLGRPVTGTFSGSLQQVVIRVLDGYDYVVKTSANSVEIALLQNRGTEPVRVATGDAAPRRRTSISRLRP
jgi:hypothetical protein